MWLNPDQIKNCVAEPRSLHELGTERISNFLVYQQSYSMKEIFFLKKINKKFHQS